MMLFALAFIVATTPPAPRPHDIQENGEEMILPDLHAPPPQPLQSAAPLWRILSSDDSFLEVALVCVIASPFIVPARILELDPAPAYLYEPTPYWHRSAGFLRFEPEPELTVFPTLAAPPPPDWARGLRRSTYRLTADVGLLGDGKWRGRSLLRIQTPSRFEIDIDASQYWLHDMNNMAVLMSHARYRFAQSRAVQFYIGLGPRILVGSRATIGGFDLAYGLDAAIARPLVLSAVASIGAAGGHLVTDLRASLGFVVSLFEITAGYEQLTIGSIHYAGPTFGLRFWL